MNEPLVRVVRGRPDPEELAALVLVLAVRADGEGSGAAGREPSPGAWASRAAGLRRPLPVGPGAWVASGRLPGVRTRAGR